MTSTVDELRTAYAAGLAASVGADNPYCGRITLASAWRTGYRKMLDEKLATSPARQTFLKALKWTTGKP